MTNSLQLASVSTPLNPSQTQFVNTFDGGNLSVDAQGNAWLVGMTDSRDLPTYRPFQPQFGGGELDGFLAKPYQSKQLVDAVEALLAD